MAQRKGNRGYHRYKCYRKRYNKKRKGKMTYQSFIPPSGNRVGKLVSGGRTAASTRQVGFPINRVFTSRYFISFDLPINLGNNADRPYTAVFDMTDIRYCIVRAGNIAGANPIAGTTSNAWDHWRVFYQKYTVIGAKVKLVWSYAGTPENAQALIVGCQLAPENGVIPSNVEVRDAIQNRKCRWTHMSAAIAAGTFNQTITYDAKRWHSLTDVSDADQLEIPFAKVMLANQSNRSVDACYLKVFAAKHDAAGNEQSVSCTMTIEYTCLGIEPLVLGFDNNPAYP